MSNNDTMIKHVVSTIICNNPVNCSAVSIVWDMAIIDVCDKGYSWMSLDWIL